MTQGLFRIAVCGMLLAPLGTLGCSSQLSEEETPVIASDEDEATEAVVNDPENP